MYTIISYSVLFQVDEMSMSGTPTITLRAINNNEELEKSS